ncbi:MAG: hypothetical protein VB860_05615 [Dehalococcoidia bacterium]
MHAAFFLGLTLDTAALLLTWAVVTAGLADEPEPTAIYLIMFPVVVVAVIRQGWPLGVIQGTVFIVWMAARRRSGSGHSITTPLSRCRSVCFS